MTRTLKNFMRLLGASFPLNEGLVAKKGNRYYLLNENIERFVRKGFLYAGIYLGEARGKRFIPSFMFLSMIAQESWNKTYVDEKTAWLFICGRDIFRRGIIKTVGATRRNSWTLIMNRFDECLGVGRIITDLNEKTETMVVKNVRDIGDFLRREN